MRQPATSKERVLRDSLCERLELIEANLTLEGIEVPVHNWHGAGGRLDIYARDSSGHRVIIEVKRSNKTAREAIHELYKYIELLRQTYGVPYDQIRCILVATDWEELLVPFSAFARGTPYEISGYKATVDTRGRLIRLEEIIPLPQSEAVRWHGEHVLFFFETSRKRSFFFDQLTIVLGPLKNMEIACFSMDYKGVKDYVLNRFCLYLIHTELTPRQFQAVQELVEEVRLLAEHVNSEEQLCSEDIIQNWVVSRMRTLCNEVQVGYDRKFTNMLKEWEVVEVERFGERISSAHFYSEGDVKEGAARRRGGHRFLYEKVISPRFKQWENSRKALLEFLGESPGWQIAVSEFIAQFEGRREYYFDCSIYNPCNTLFLLYEIHRRIPFPRMPSLYIAVSDSMGNLLYRLLGTLLWTGSISSHSAEESIREVAGSLDIAFSASFIGDAGSFDNGYCRAFGLSYVAFAWRYPQGGGRPELIKGWMWKDDQSMDIRDSALLSRTAYKLCVENHAFFEEFAKRIDSYCPGWAGDSLDLEQYTTWDLDYYKKVPLALEGGVVIDLEILVERLDLVLRESAKEIGPDEPDLDDEEITFYVEIRKAAICAADALLRDVPQLAIEYMRITFLVFAYAGLLDFRYRDIKTMWTSLLEEGLSNRLHPLEWAWLKQVIMAVKRHKALPDVLISIIDLKERGQFERLEDWIEEYPKGLTKVLRQLGVI